MPKARRTRYAFYYLEDEYSVDAAALLSGTAASTGGGAHVLALALLTGERHRLEREEFLLAMSLPAGEWLESDSLNPDQVRSLTDKALLLSDSEDGRLKALRERDEALHSNEWNLYAALYHYMTQWSGVEGREDEEDLMLLHARSKAAAQAVVAEYGLPPREFAEVHSDHVLSLPGIDREGEFYRSLMARRTTRAFDPDTPMTLAQLDTVLRYVFGCHGYGMNMADVVCIKRTSPSGGGLHPIEVYPIVSNATGVEPGIYHYNARDHSLARLRAGEAAELQQMATAFMGGQSFFGTAHVSFVLTARFYRNHWKYRRHQKAYAGILMDAAHLSQTLYLVSAELGIGAFVTIAINGRDIEKRFGLDGVREGVIAMAGCGPRAQGDSPLDLRFSPQPPRA
jgi:putative peptide maturation dehydrogenase